MASRLVVKIGATTLTEPFNISWQDQLNSTGTGSFCLLNDDSQISVPTLGSLVSVDVDAVAGALYFVVETIKKVDVDANEGAGAYTTFSGRGSVCELEHVGVYPALGLVTSTAGQTSGYRVARSPFSDDRLFGWPDPVRGGLLNNSPSTSSNNVTRCTGTDRPVGWPDGDAYYQGAVGGSSTCYLVAEVLAADSTKDHWIVWASFHDEGELYLNGVLILQVTGSQVDPTKTWRVSVQVTPGQNQILSAKVHKTGSTNAIFACTVHEVGSASNFLIRTLYPSQNWGIFADPSPEPGISAGELIFQILDEAATSPRSLALPGTWSLNFTNTHDSNGDAWPLIPIFPAKIGESLLDVLHRLSDSWIEFAVLSGSGGRQLSVWNAPGVAIPGGGTATGRGSASGVTVTVGSNALSVTHELTAA